MSADPKDKLRELLTTINGSVEAADRWLQARGPCDWAAELRAIENWYRPQLKV